LLLRFHTTIPVSSKIWFSSFEKISKLFKITQYRAKKLIHEAMKDQEKKPDEKEVPSVRFRNGKPVTVKRFGKVLHQHL
jgi:argininosuccinate synthase